jgi:hypothetical protein
MESEDFSQYMNVRHKPKLPLEISEEGQELLIVSLFNAAGGAAAAITRLRLAQIEYPGKPEWWWCARALWEIKRGLC